MPDIYIFRRKKNTIFLCVRDKQTKKQFSLKPLKAYENIDSALFVGVFFIFINSIFNKKIN